MAFHPERWTAFLTALSEMEEGSAEHTSLLGYMDANILPEMAEFLEAEEKLNRKRERLWRRRREEDINKKFVWKLKKPWNQKSRMRRKRLLLMLRPKRQRLQRAFS